MRASASSKNRSSSMPEGPVRPAWRSGLNAREKLSEALLLYELLARASSSAAILSSTGVSVPSSPASRISPTIFRNRSRRAADGAARRTPRQAPRRLASAPPRQCACAGCVGRSDAWKSQIPPRPLRPQPERKRGDLRAAWVDVHAVEVVREDQRRHRASESSTGLGSPRCSVRPVALTSRVGFLGPGLFVDG